MPDLGPNSVLIGRPGSRSQLDTPALILDLDAPERNIAAMAAHASAVGVALRPRAKTHKSVRIAELQVAAGALGVGCATLSEAEVMVADGIPGELITSPQVTPSKIASACLGGWTQCTALRDLSLRLHRCGERERPWLRHHRRGASKASQPTEAIQWLRLRAPMDSCCEFFGDEHGKLILPGGAVRQALGARVECVTPHCDPTNNLCDFNRVVRGDTLIDIWPKASDERRACVDLVRLPIRICACIRS
jgi:D-serine deaminase-like pyridoxal phosphate-dependent protein